jgi:hypothetical protein
MIYIYILVQASYVLKLKNMNSNKYFFCLEK